MPNRLALDGVTRYIGQIVTELVRDDVALTAALNDGSVSLAPVYVYEAKMAFFLEVARSPGGARTLLLQGQPKRHMCMRLVLFL